MFTLHRNRIDSDEGLSIEFTRDRLYYLSRHLRLRVNHEMLPQEKALVIWQNSIRDLNPDADLTTVQSNVIVQNIVRAFRAVGYDITII